MKSVISIFSIILSVATTYAQMGATYDIEMPQKRDVTMKAAARILKAPTAEEIQVPGGLLNPFDPTAEVRVEVKTGRPGSDRELLELLASQVMTTGVMGREDSMVLLIKGQKGVKLNDKLTLSFDGTPYEVEVIGIDHYNFSLRYNQAEVTRPIKQGKNP